MRLQAFNNDFLRFTSGLSTPAKRHGANAVPVKLSLADSYVVEEQLGTHPQPFIQLTVDYQYILFFPTSPSFTPERPPAVAV
ncbi:MAG TPA: hypothetical protein VGM89_01010 [Puia sp.]